MSLTNTSLSNPSLKADLPGMLRGEGWVTTEKLDMVKQVVASSVSHPLIMSFYWHDDGLIRRTLSLLTSLTYNLY